MAVPFVLILIMNVLMVRLFVKKKKSKALGERRNKKEDNAIYCVLAITANLIFCWLPYNILYLVRKNNADYFDGPFFVIYICVYLFSGLNPIILLHFNTNYRTVLVEKFSCIFGLIKFKKGPSQN
jgi:hypothetical protein